MRGAARLGEAGRAERAHRRNAGEPLAESLYAAAFVIDGDQQVRLTERVDRGGQPLELRGRFVIAGEKNRAAGQRMEKAFPVGVGQLQSFDAEGKFSEGQ